MADAKKKALIVQGGWEGHTPQQSAALFADVLENEGLDVTVKDTLEIYTDPAFMEQLSLVVPIWTMGEISKPQWQGLDKAVQSGVGLAGFHGGMIDAFRANTEYQWMTGAQWVAHPGNDQLTYRVNIADRSHPITRDVADFTLPQTEQYYCHFDPGVKVLCTTVFDQDAGDPSLYRHGTVMPYAWTKTWGRGRVFGACWGHTFKDFDVPEAKEIVRRGMLWAAR
jgi:hypothetical protein